MKGLLRKDLYSLKGYGITTLAIVVVYAIFAIVSGNISMLTAMILVFCSVMPMSSASIDDASKWNAYAQCMPISRKTIVRERYAFVLLIAASSVAVVLLITLLSALRTPLDWSETLLTNGIFLCMALVVNSVSIPVIYKFGAEKSRLVIILIFLVCMIPFLLIMGDMTTFPVLPTWTIWLAPVFLLALLIGSYNISLRIYTNKEL